MTIRAKLYAAIVLTILGPLATIAVALHGMSQLGDNFDEVQQRARHESLAREIKFGVTDLNGWQTAYGYAGDGRFRHEFVSSADKLRRDLAAADEALTDPFEGELTAQLDRDFRRFMALDVVAYRALRDGDAARLKRILLAPELVVFQRMAGNADELAAAEAAQAKAADRAFSDARDDARRRLIAVALGAGIAILLLLATAQDVARLALEGERSRTGKKAGDRGADGPS
jgi:hypothetical protein